MKKSDIVWFAIVARKHEQNRTSVDKLDTFGKSLINSILKKKEVHLLFASDKI